MAEINEGPVVNLVDLDIHQEDNVILKDLNLSIEKGEFVYLIGRTGAGKSSLLKALYADLPIQKGKAYIAGFQVDEMKKKYVPNLRRAVGIVFQDFQLLADRTVADNLMFVMQATGWKSKAGMKQRLSEVLMRTGMGAFSSKLPHQLSGGEQQRIVIARALLNEPSILIADEPTGNLDPEVAEGILRLFKAINKSGTAILMATHNHLFLDKFPARVLKCTEGKILDSNVEEFELGDALY